MKKYISLLICLLLIFTATCSFAEPAVAGPVLAIDTVHIYEGMEKSYADGYLPTISEDEAIVVLPLLSTAAVGKLTVTVNLGDPASSPFIYKNYKKEFTCNNYEFNGETVECFLIQFVLPLKAERINGTYPVTFSVSGKTAAGEQLTQDFPLFITISNGVNPHAPQPEPLAPSLTPKLMVESYQLDKKYLAAGERAKLKVTIRNTSSSQTANNIKLSFIENSGEILPVGTGAKYCKQISKGSTYTWNFEVEAITTAQSRPHLATITMEYEDNQGNAVSASDQIIIQARQPVRLEYEEPTLPPRVTQGDTPTFTITLMNLGKSTIYNTLLKFELPGLSSGGSVLVGTIAPGTSAEGRANFRIAKDVLGDVRGTLFLTYEDEYGENYEKEIPLATTIEEKKDISVPKETETPAATFPKTIVIVVGSIVLLAVAYFAISRWLKEKKAREEDEMRL